MRTRNSRFTLDASADAAAKGEMTTGAERPAVVCDADDGRTALSLSFNAFDAGAPAGSAPVDVPGVYALLLFEGADDPARVPSWDRYTEALAPGSTLTVGPADAPLAGLRVTAALHVPPDVDPALFVFSVVAGEYPASRC